MLCKSNFLKKAMALTMAVVLMVSGVAATTTAEAATKTISFEKAVSIAKKEVKGLVTQVELDHSGRKLIYEIEILDSSNKEHDLDIDAETGDVLTHYKSNRAESSSKAKKLRSATVSVEKAIAAVKKDTGADTLTSYNLDIENGKVCWEINMLDKDNVEYEALVDAKTGKILYVESEYDD